MKNANEKIIYQGKIVEVVEYPVYASGQEKIFEKARRSPGVRLIVKTPDHRFILNREKRHELGLSEDLRLPGGKVFDTLTEHNDFLSKQKEDSEIIEAAKSAAIREAEEEIGIIPEEIELLSVSKCGATMEWDLYYFVVEKYREAKKNLKETESLEIMGAVKLSGEELKEKALAGDMSEDRSVAVVLKYLHNQLSIS